MGLESKQSQHLLRAPDFLNRHNQRQPQQQPPGISGEQEGEEEGQGVGDVHGLKVCLVEDLYCLLELSRVWQRAFRHF